MQRPLAGLSSFFATLFFASATVALAVSQEQIATLFRPFLAEQVTLAPDGRHVAYTEHVKDELHVIILDLEEPYGKVTINVGGDVGLTFSKEKKRLNLRLLRWSTPHRLVFSPEEQTIRFPPTLIGRQIPPKYIAPVIGIDEDGRNLKTLADGGDFSVDLAPESPPLVDTATPPKFEIATLTRRSEIVGFLGGERTQLLVRALGRGGRVPVPTSLFKVNVMTGKKTEIGQEFASGKFGSDWQGQMRLGYFQTSHSAERQFQVLGSPASRFNEPWLGALAHHFKVSPKDYFGERAYPLGFDFDPAILYIASNVGRDTFGIYSLNLKTKQRLSVAFEDSTIDLAPLEPTYPAPQLIFDESRGQLVGVRTLESKPVSLWSDPFFVTLQRELEQKFPERTLEILEWDDLRTVFLIRVTGGTEPGRYFVFKKAENLALEILRRAPWLQAAEMHSTKFFEFDTNDGVHLSGYITLPKSARLNPPPAVICFAEGFPLQPQVEFDRQAQVLASMGLMVIRVNHRGVSGLGRKHRDAILGGIDRVPLEDAIATLNWIGARWPIDRRRVATLGSGFGGYLAVRAMQLRPDLFRCAVIFNAPLDPEAWLRPTVSADLGASVDFAQEVTRAFLERAGTAGAPVSVLDHPETITHPVFQIVDAGRADAIATANLQLRGRLRRLGKNSDYIEVNEDYGNELPEARTRVYERLEEFFNLNLYDYGVKLGPLKVIEVFK